MPKPYNNNERNLFTELDLRIMLCNEKIKNHRRSIEKTKRMCGWNGPSSMGGIDYSKETSHSTHISFMDGLNMIQKDEANIRAIAEERKELRRSKKRVEKIYSSLTGYEEKIYYHRIILKETQQDTADKIGLSVRQEQRIEGDMKDKGLF
jgi:DNA-binding transcriptional MerR regulator